MVRVFFCCGGFFLLWRPGAFFAVEAGRIFLFCCGVRSLCCGDRAWARSLLAVETGRVLLLWRLGAFLFAVATGLADAELVSLGCLNQKRPPQQNKTGACFCCGGRACLMGRLTKKTAFSWGGCRCFAGSRRGGGGGARGGGGGAVPWTFNVYSAHALFS